MIFQHIYAFQIIRFVKPFKTLFCLPFNFLVRLKTPTTQPFLEIWEQIIVAGGQIWKIRMRNRFKTQFMLFCLCNVRCVRWCIVIMKKGLFSSSNVAVSSWFRQPIDPIMQYNMLQYNSKFQEFETALILKIQKTQPNLEYWSSSNHPSFLKVVDEDYSMCIPKNTSYNFPCRLLRFRTLWRTFTRLNPLFWPLTWLRSIVMDPCFIHRHKSTQKLFWIAIKIGQILLRSGHTNAFLVDCK